MNSQSPDAMPIADTWFGAEEADENGVRRIREVHVHDYGGGNMWLVEGRDRCLLVETGLGVMPLRAFVETLTDKPVMAFASLGYYDHAGGLHQFDERLIHRADAHRVAAPTRRNTAAERYLGGAFRALPYAGFDPATYVMPGSEPTRRLDDGDEIDLGGRRFEVLHLPGVTAGATGLFERATGLFFSGEALIWDDGYVYDGEPADVTDDADRAAFRHSLARMADLPAIAVYPGHFEPSDAASMREAIGAYLAGQNTAAPPHGYG